MPCAPQRRRERKRPRAQRQALTTAEKRGEGEGTDKKGQKLPEVILSDLDLLHQVSGWTGDGQGKEVGGMWGFFQTWLSGWPRIPQTLKKVSRPSYANL